MPKDSAPTRSAILAAAVHTLKRTGVDGFSLDVVARRAGVVKGLVLYHFESRGRLLRVAAAQLASERSAAFERALSAGAGTAGVDACWEELQRQAADGTARAWLAVTAAGLVDRSDKNEDVATAARQALWDGCAAALATGVRPDELRDAYHALCLALLDVA